MSCGFALSTPHKPNLTWFESRCSKSEGIWGQLCQQDELSRSKRQKPSDSQSVVNPTQQMQSSFGFFSFCLFGRKPRSQRQLCDYPGMRLITAFRGPQMINLRMKYRLLQSICFSSELPRGCNFRIKRALRWKICSIQDTVKNIFPVVNTTKNMNYFYYKLYVVSNANNLCFSAICWMSVHHFFWQNQTKSCEAEQ